MTLKVGIEPRVPIIHVAISQAIVNHYRLLTDYRALNALQLSTRSKKIGRQPNNLAQLYHGVTKSPQRILTVTLWYIADHLEVIGDNS